MEYYTLKICGEKRELPLLPIGPKFKIASFNLLGDAVLVSKLAKELYEKIKYMDFEILVGLEVKTLPLIYELSKLLGKERYVILRKQYAGYMIKPIEVGGKWGLMLDGEDAKRIRDKKIILVDDVVTTGKTIRLAQELIEKAGGKTKAVISVIKQGEQKEPIEVPFFYITTLPLFDK